MIDTAIHSLIKHFQYEEKNIMELKLFHRLTVVGESSSERFSIYRDNNSISFRSESGFSESYVFDEIAQYNKICPGCSQNSCTEFPLSYVIQGSTFLVRQKFARKIYEIACSEMKTKGIGYQLKRIFSWGHTSLRANSGIDEIGVLDEDVLSSLEGIIEESFNRSCTDKSIVLFSLYCHDDSVEGWRKQPTHCVMMLPSWKQSNKYLKQHIINFYSHLDYRNNLLKKWLTPSVCIETLIHLEKDSLSEALHWCRLSSKTVCGNQCVLHPSSQSESLDRKMCVISEDQITEREEHFSLCSQGGSIEEIKSLKKKLLSEVSSLQSEIKELQQTKAMLSVSIGPLLSEIKNARELAKKQELSFLVQSQDLRHLLAAAYSSAAAEHKSILSQISDAIDALLISGKTRDGIPSA